MSEILPSSSLGPGPVEVSQKDLKPFHSWRHSQKIQNPEQKIFFIADQKTCQVFWGLEQLSSTTGWEVMSLLKYTAYAWCMPDFSWNCLAADVLLIRKFIRITAIEMQCFLIFHEIYNAQWTMYARKLDDTQCKFHFGCSTTHQFFTPQKIWEFLRVCLRCIVACIVAACNNARCMQSNTLDEQPGSKDKYYSLLSTKNIIQEIVIGIGIQDLVTGSKNA